MQVMQNAAGHHCPTSPIMEIFLLLFLGFGGGFPLHVSQLHHADAWPDLGNTRNQFLTTGQSNKSIIISHAQYIWFRFCPRQKIVSSSILYLIALVFAAWWTIARILVCAVTLSSPLPRRFLGFFASTSFSFYSGYTNETSWHNKIVQLRSLYASSFLNDSPAQPTRYDNLICPSR